MASPDYVIETREVQKPRRRKSRIRLNLFRKWFNRREDTTKVLPNVSHTEHNFKFIFPAMFLYDS